MFKRCHLAVQFAHVMGAEVTVLSQTMNKQEESLEMGAEALRVQT
ncbi:hypothetical protein KAI36_02687 [Paenibacillus sp. S02]|nr:hypothetical protein KAI36_02687 [Paenibacillus sp. S02]